MALEKEEERLLSSVEDDLEVLVSVWDELVVLDLDTLFRGIAVFFGFRGDRLSACGQ